MVDSSTSLCDVHAPLATLNRDEPSPKKAWQRAMKRQAHGPFATACADALRKVLLDRQCWNACSAGTPAVGS